MSITLLLEMKEAILDDQEQTFNTLLNSITSHVDIGITLLQFSLLKKTKKYTELILQHKMDNNLNTILHLACENKLDQLLKEIVNQKLLTAPMLLIRNIDKETILHCALKFSETTANKRDETNAIAQQNSVKSIKFTVECGPLKQKSCG